LNTFDKNLKKKLYNAEMEVSDGMWASIESQIPVKKEKPKFWFIFLITAALIAFSYVLKQSDTSQTSPEKQLLTQQQKIDLAKDKQANSTNLTSLAQGSEMTYNPIAGDASASGEISDNGLASLSKRSELTETKHSPTSEFNSNTTKKLKFVTNPFKSSTAYQNNNSLKLIEKFRINEIGKEVSSIPQLTTIKKVSLLQKPNSEPTLATKIIDRYSVATCPKFEPKSLGVYFFSELSAGLNFQHLSTNNLELTDLVNQRNQNEMNAVSISSTIGIGKEFRNGLLVETGINYDKIRISFRLDRTQEIIEHIDCVNDEGLVITKTDTTIVNNSSNLNNTFTQVNIPLVIGYRHYLNNRISLAGKIGALLNLNSSNQGQFIDNNGNLTKYSSDNVSSSLFQTNLDISYLANLQMQVNLGHHFNAYLGVNTNFYPSNFGLSGNTIQQRYTKIGMNLGVSYQL